MRPASHVPEQSGGSRAGKGAFVIANLCLSATSLVFHFAMTRLLGPAAYGEVASLLTLLVIISMPLNAVQAAVTQRVAESRAQAYGLRHFTAKSLAWSFGAVVLLGSMGGPIDLFLHLRNAEYVFLMAFCIPGLVLSAVFQGVLLAEGRYAPVAVCQAVGAGVSRIAISVVLVELGLGASGALVGSLGASVVQVLILAPSVKVYFRQGTELFVHVGDAGRSMAAIGATTLLTTMESWLARHYLESGQAGLFVSAATMGRMPLFLPGAILLVMFPAFVRDRLSRSKSGRNLLLTILSGVAVSAIALVIIGIWPSGLLQLLFGPQFRQAAPFLLIVCTAQLLVGPVTVLVYFLLAQRSGWSLVGWGACAGQFVLGAAFHASPTALAYVLLSTNGGCLCILSFVTIYHFGRSTDANRRKWGAEVVEPEGTAIT